MSRWRDDRRSEGWDVRDQGEGVVSVLIVGDDEPGTAVLQDETDLLPVQPGVDRDSDQSGVPGGEKCLEVLGTVAHDNRDAIALCQIVIGAKG